MSIRTDELKNDPHWIPVGNSESVQTIEKISDRFGVDRVLRAHQDHVNHFGKTDIVMLLHCNTGKIRSIPRKEILDGPPLLDDLKEALSRSAQDTIMDRQTPDFIKHGDVFWAILLGDNDAEWCCCILSTSIKKVGTA